jgi:hypothetical protein
MPASDQRVDLLETVLPESLVGVVADPQVEEH